MLVCTLEPSCFLFGRISSARKSAKMSLITRSGETGCCVTVIYFKSEPGHSTPALQAVSAVVLDLHSFLLFTFTLQLVVLIIMESVCAA